MLTVVTFIILVIVVVSSFIVIRLITNLFRFILNDEKTNRELNRRRDIRLSEVLKKIQQAQIFISETQDALDTKMDALSRFVDERNTYVTYQQEEFKAFAKSDMLSARRDELIRVNELKVALERIISMTTMSRQAPAAIDALALESVTNRIKELEMILESG